MDLIPLRGIQKLKEVLQMVGKDKEATSYIMLSYNNFF